MSQYTIGLDYGTNTVRALIVNVANGDEIASAVWPYAHGTQGVILARDPNLARQHPADYLKGAEVTIKAVLASAKKKVRNFTSEQIIGIGVDTTGSSPLPVDAEGQPLAFNKKFANEPTAMTWLWKDHTGVAEAAEITEMAREIRPQYIAKCGGVYSSEWFFSKIFRCLRVAPKVFDAAYSWMGAGGLRPGGAYRHGTLEQPAHRRCFARRGTKRCGMRGGVVTPDEEFLSRLHPKLGALRARLSRTGRQRGLAPSADLTAAWAKRTGLSAGIPVAVGAFDAHLGAVLSGVSCAGNALVKIIGTSTCVTSRFVRMAREAGGVVPGLCGIGDGSVLPGYFGLEAGQSAVGDIFNWWVHYIQPYGDKLSHKHLDAEAMQIEKRANPACSRWIGIMAIERCWWTSG